MQKCWLINWTNLNQSKNEDTHDTKHFESFWMWFQKTNTTQAKSHQQNRFTEILQYLCKPARTTFEKHNQVKSFYPQFNQEKWIQSNNMNNWRILKHTIEMSKQQQLQLKQFQSYWMNSSSSIYEMNCWTEATSKEYSQKNFQMLINWSIQLMTKQSEWKFNQILRKESKIDCVWMLRLCKIYFQNIDKMPIEWITEYELEPLFKIFLKRIGFKNYDEYIELFGDDIEKRKETVRRFKKTYPNFSLKKSREWKTS